MTTFIRTLFWHIACHWRRHSSLQMRAKKF